jgi:hypothetical protein
MLSVAPQHRFVPNPDAVPAKPALRKAPKPEDQVDPAEERHAVIDTKRNDTCPITNVRKEKEVEGRAALLALRTRLAVAAPVVAPVTPTATPVVSRPTHAVPTSKGTAPAVGSVAPAATPVVSRPTHVEPMVKVRELPPKVAAPRRSAHATPYSYSR